jgi:hypothetical protein
MRGRFCFENRAREISSAIDTFVRALSVLRETFREEYRAYAATTRRFIPGVY